MLYSEDDPKTALLTHTDPHGSFQDSLEGISQALEIVPLTKGDEGDVFLVRREWIFRVGTGKRPVGLDNLNLSYRTLSTGRYVK